MMRASHSTREQVSVDQSVSQSVHGRLYNDAIIQTSMVCQSVYFVYPFDDMGGAAAAAGARQLPTPGSL